MIEREAHRLERLIRDLLDLARLRRRSFDVTLTPVDLGEIASEAVSPPRPQAQAYGVNLELPRRAAGRCDRGRRPHAAGPLEPGRERDPLHAEGRHGRDRGVPRPARSVDDGPGLEPDDLDRAFERFYLWDRYGSDRPVGSGLGLAIVAELAEAMGGRVTVESTPGDGSVFTLELEPAPLRGAHGLRSGLRSAEIRRTQAS